MPFISYEPLPNSMQPCTHPEHNPPGMIVLTPGTYTYQCPACGQITTFTVGPRPTCESHTIQDALPVPLGYY